MCGVVMGTLLCEFTFFYSCRRGAFVRGEWCFLSHFAGRFFSTRVMGGVAVVGVERVCDFCVRVLFLIPVQLWDAHVAVWCRDAW